VYLCWFGHLKKKEESSLIKKIYEADLVGIAVKERPKGTFPDQIEQILEKGLIPRIINKYGSVALKQ
jgi:hypothetical protein